MQVVTTPLDKIIVSSYWLNPNVELEHWYVCMHHTEFSMMHTHHTEFVPHILHGSKHSFGGLGTMHNNNYQCTTHAEFVTHTLHDAIFPNP